jgi:hypothetical protein
MGAGNGQPEASAFDRGRVFSFNEWRFRRPVRTKPDDPEAERDGLSRQQELFIVNTSKLNRTVSAVISRHGASLLAATTGLVASAVLPGNAFAQQSTIGAQLGTMAQEASTAGGTLASTAMYVAALVCFIGGVWSLWQSRQPQNRESGRVAMGLAGLVLCGLFVTGGSWINKAAQTATGTAASITSTAGVVSFQ